MLAHVADGAGQEAAGAARRIKQSFTRLGINTVHHKGRDRAWDIILARVASTLQVVEELFVEFFVLVVDDL